MSNRHDIPANVRRIYFTGALAAVQRFSSLVEGIAGTGPENEVLLYYLRSEEARITLEVEQARKEAVGAGRTH